MFLFVVIFFIWWIFNKGSHSRTLTSPLDSNGCFSRVCGPCVSRDELHHPLPSSLIDSVDPYFEYDAHRLKHHFTLLTSGCKGCLY